jgi:small-conductance mechanosensitive channel
MNPTLRGFLVLALLAAVVVVLQLQATLFALSLILRIAFFLAIAFFVYLVWRERREEIAAWSTRSRVVFYGSALLIVADVSVLLVRGVAGLDAFAFFVVLGLAGFSMWRVWRDEHTLSI